VVDNTNLLAEHRFVYKQIATGCGAEIVVRAVAAEAWLEPADCSPAVDVLVVRDLRRCLKNGSPPLGRQKIERAVNIARDNRNGRSTEEWLAWFPSPKYPRGLVEFHNALVYRSDAIDADAAAAVASDRVQQQVGIDAGRVAKGIHRGFGEYHITLLTPSEHRALQANPQGIALPEKIESEPCSIGVGRVMDGGGEWVLFVAYDWPWGQEWRKSLGLPPHDFHVTLAFSESDIHNVPKDASTCEW
jgi:hypothetical protein